MTRSLFTLACLWGCAPGQLAWSGGDEALRTALFVEQPLEGERLTTIFLSNGRFDCDLPQLHDPAAQSEALLALQAAACREGARHLSLQLHARPHAALEGVYAGGERAETDWYVGDADRVARATWISIDEAVVNEKDGVVRQFEVTELTWAYGAANDGAVRVLAGGDTVRGRFDLPQVHVSGRFEAERCAPESTLFAALSMNPMSACP